MKESKSLLSQLILKVGRPPDKARQFYCQVVETKTWRTNHVWSTSFVENTSRPNSPRNLRNLRLKISVNLCKSVSNFSSCLLCLFVAENVQSKTTNYAKRTQFPKKSNVYNRNINNELQRKTNNGHLVKTNPNKANFTRLWRVKLPHCLECRLF
jgi:hypothetical protein